MLSAAAAAGAAASFIGTPPLRSPSCRPLPVRCSVTALEGQIWSALALANDALPGADVVDLDLLDALILTPLLVPILGLATLRSGAAAAGAKLAQLDAERSLETAKGRIARRGRRHTKHTNARRSRRERARPRLPRVQILQLHRLP